MRILQDRPLARPALAGLPPANAHWPSLLQSMARGCTFNPNYALMHNLPEGQTKALLCLGYPDKNFLKEKFFVIMQ